MFKKRIWLGIILSIILLVFSINGFTAYYEYTQESGANFYVSADDKADALEDTNEIRQIVDDLGALLVHSKRNDLYPKDGTTGGTIQIPEDGLKFGNDPENNDIAAYISGEMTWQTKAELGLDLSLYYLKTEIDTLSELETIYTKDIIDSDELAALKFTDLADTPANYTGQAGKYVKVNAGETDLEFGTPAGGGTYLELTDTPAAYDNGKYAKSTADGVVWDDPAGVGDMLKATYDSDEDGDIDVAAGGTEKSAWTLYAIPYLSGTTAFGEIPIGTAEYALTVNAGANGYDWTLFDLSLYYLKTEIDTRGEIETIWGVSLVNDGDLDLYYLKTAIDTQGEVETIWGVTLATDTEISTKVDDDLTSDVNLNEHSIRVDATLSSDGDYSAVKLDSWAVGENVVFGQLVYFN